MFLKIPFKRIQREPMAPTAGFTILEAIFGIFVFTVGILAVASMQTRSLSANVNAFNISKAVTVGANLVADLRPVRYSAPGLTGNSQDGQVHSHSDVGIHTVTYHVRRIDIMKGEAAVITSNVTWNDRSRQHAEKSHYFKIDEYLD